MNTVKITGADMKTVGLFMKERFGVTSSNMKTDFTNFVLDCTLAWLKEGNAGADNSIPF